MTTEETKEFKLELRYFVVKRKDMKYLPPLQQSHLHTIMAFVSKGREAEGKKPLNCLCIEDDWPEYPAALKMLAARVRGEKAAEKQEQLPHFPSNFDPKELFNYCLDEDTKQKYPFLEEWMKVAQGAAETKRVMYSVIGKGSS